MDYLYVTSIQELTAYIGDAKLVAFDFETSPDDAYRDEPKAALDVHKAHIVGVSFSVKEGTAVYVPIAHRTGINADAAEVHAFLKTLMSDTTVTKVAHNLSFEAMFLYALDIVVQPPCYDTIAASQLTLKTNTSFRDLHDSGLKKLVPEFFDVEMAEFSTVTDGRHFDELNAQGAETVNYACADSDYTLRLYHLFNDWFDRFMPKHRYVVETIESPTAVYCGLMKYNGLRVNQELMLKKQQEAETKTAQLVEDITFFIGDVDIGANANTAAFKKYLFKDLGLPVLKTTAKYQEAADDQVLIMLRDWCHENRPDLVRLFELVHEYRKWGKIKSTYIDGYISHINSATGRIHPDFFQLGTETGRFSSRNPNMQNTPRKDSDPVGVRDFIVAPEGCALLSLDFSQIELRVGAFYCRDEKMLETYRAGGDIHAQTTAVIYHIPMETALDKNAEGYKERRTIAKNCNFGVFYGLFPNGLQRTLKYKAGLDTTKADCGGIIHSLLTGYPKLSRWQEETKVRARFRKYSETWLGRRRYLPNISSLDWSKKSFAERCALNTPIQGTAADILKLALGRIVLGMPERPWLKPLLQIHDELVFELPVDRVPETVDFVRKCMETQPFPEFDVPIIAEASVGESFGKLKEME